MVLVGVLLGVGILRVLSPVMFQLFGLKLKGGVGRMGSAGRFFFSPRNVPSNKLVGA